MGFSTAHVELRAFCDGGRRCAQWGCHGAVGTHGAQPSKAAHEAGWYVVLHSDGRVTTWCPLASRHGVRQRNMGDAVFLLPPAIVADAEGEA